MGVNRRRPRSATLLWAVAAIASLPFIGCPLYRDETLYDFSHEEASAIQQEDTLYLDFGAESGRAYLLRGWSTDEKDNVGRTFVWATDTRAELFFGVTSPQDIELIVTCRPNDAIQKQTLQVDVNGQPLGGPSELKRDFRDYRFFLPKRVLRTGRNILGLTFAAAARPGAPDGAPQSTPSGDARTLAACFDSLLFAPYNLQERELKQARSEPPTYVKELQSRGRSAIVQRLPGELTYALRIPPESQLSFSCGFAPEDWKTTEGGEFCVTLQADGQEPQVLFQQFSDPKKRRSHRTLFKKRVSLDDWAGKLARITFSVKAGYEKVSYPTYGIWIDPRIGRRHYFWQAQAATASTSESPAERDLKRKLGSYNLAIVLLDAASASHFGCYGYHLPTTPNIDKIAADGVQFMNAYTQAVYTRASTGSLMTGEYPDLHRVLFATDRLPESAYTLAEMLAASGARTASFVGNPHAGENAGYRQGFADFLEMFKVPGYQNLAGDFRSHLFPWLAKNRDNRFFAYVHYREPHFISDPPREYLDRFSTGYRGKIDAQNDRNNINLKRIPMNDADLAHIRSVYDATLSYGDHEVGEIVAELQRTGLWDKTILIVLADHGEALWEHGYFGHNVHVYEDMAHIPLVIHFPKGSGVGQPRRIDGLVQTIDIFTTFADVMGSAEGLKHAAGKSLVPLLAGDSAGGERFVYTRTLWGRATYGVRHERWEYVYRAKADEEELYDLWNDRLETRNLATERPVVTNYLRSHLLGWMHQQQELAGQGAAPGKATFDEETMKSLTALGYVNAREADEIKGN